MQAFPVGAEFTDEVFVFTFQFDLAQRLPVEIEDIRRERLLSSERSQEDVPNKKIAVRYRDARQARRILLRPRSGTSAYASIMAAQPFRRIQR